MSSDGLVLIHGEERFLIDEAVREWRRQPGAAELDVEVYDAPARLVELRRSIAEVPLFDPERRILVRDPPQLSGTGRRGADSPQVLAEIVKERPATTSLCLVAHNRVPPQSPVLAAVQASRGRVAYFSKLNARDVRAWLEREIARRQLRLDSGAIDLMLEVVGSDLGSLNSELEKLHAFAGSTRLGVSKVKEALAGDQPVELWGVLEELLGPRPGSGAAALDRLLSDGQPSQYLLAILAGQIRDLMLVQAHLHTRGSAAGLAAEIRAPQWRIDRLTRQARAVPPALVAAWLSALHDADRRVKAGEIGDVDALRLVGLRAAAEVVASRATR